MGVSVALVGAGVGSLPLLFAGIGSATLGFGLRSARRLRGRRLLEELRCAFAASVDRMGIFERVVAAVVKPTGAQWAGLVAWNERALTGTIELQHGRDAPPEPSLFSWLVREAPTDGIFAAPGRELGSAGVALALPLRRQNSALVGFLVFTLPRRPPGFVEFALGSCLDELGVALADRPEEPDILVEPALTAVR